MPMMSEPYISSSNNSKRRSVFIGWQKQIRLN